MFICVCLTVAGKHENTASASICQLVWLGLKMCHYHSRCKSPPRLPEVALLRPPSDLQSHKLITNIQQVQTAASAHQSEARAELLLVLTRNL